MTFELFQKLNLLQELRKNLFCYSSFCCPNFKSYIVDQRFKCEEKTKAFRASAHKNTGRQTKRKGGAHMKNIGRTIIYTLGQVFAFNVVLPAWAVFNMVTGK